MPYDPDKFKAAHQASLAEQGLPPGHTEGQPTLGDQIEAAKQKELAARAAIQNNPAEQGFGQDLRQAGAGLKEGFMRQEPPPGAPGPERFGATVGKYAPLVAGSMAGSMLMPEAAAGSLLARAGGQFLGAGGGEAAGLAGSAALGGNAPPTAGGMASAGAKTGLGAAAAELGMGALGKTASKLLEMAPEFAHAYLKVPVEAIKRALANPNIIPKGGPSAQMAVESKAINSLSRIQDGILAARHESGKAVDAALENLHTKTKGLKVFDTGPLAQDLKQFLKDNNQTTDPTVRKLMGQDYTKIMGVVKSLENNPMKSAKSMVQIRRELDALQSFSPAGVPKIESDAGQRAVSRLASNFREVINGAGKVLKDDSLTKANQAFHETVGNYEQAQALVGTKDQGRLALLQRVKNLESKFNEGGVSQDLISELGRNFPKLAGHANDLADSLAARSFTKHAIGSPSGTIKDFIRLLASPENIGAGIKAGQAAAPVAKAIGKVARPVAATATRSLGAALAQPRQP